MQPTYLPWAGYFNLMTCVDEFVFLDDAQLQKNSWHNRNIILINHQSHWITVPVKRTALGQLLTGTQLCEGVAWRRKHSTTLQQTYARHPCKEAVRELAEFILEDNSASLATLNIRLITHIARRLDISTRIHRASEMVVNGRRTEKVLDILRYLHASVYLSPAGASGYLEADGFTLQSDIELQLQAYTPHPYPQYSEKIFVPNLSIVDVLANLGWSVASTYIGNQSGEKE